MKKLFLLCTALLLSLGVLADNYRNFRATAYIMAGDVNRIGTVENWEKSYAEFSKNLKLDKVYIETFRDMTYSDDKALDAAIKFFRSKGIQISGGITYNWRGGVRQRWESFCYSNPEHLAIIKDVIERTAARFDEIVLDDYYFTNCKDDHCIEAKGDQSWGEFRSDLLDRVARDYIVGPAHAVNPKCKVIVKYPNWYDHFYGLGFDLARGPFTFDGVYTGTETRDHTSEQHLQAYESYGIIRYFENIRPQHNFGGWVDTGGASYPDLFAEQLWLTLLAKTPEITLFNYSSMARPFRTIDRPWAAYGPTLNLDDLRAESARRGVTEPTWGRVAEYAYQKIDAVLGALGQPKSIPAYKPYNAEGEEFLHNYMGMAGLPVEIVPEFPTEGNMVLLTEAAAADKDILAKMKAHLKKGGDIVVTSGFYAAMQDRGIKGIFEMQATGRKATIDTVVTAGPFGNRGAALKTDVPMTIPIFTYFTNDSWEMISTLDYGNGWPLLHHSVYSEGNVYVWVIPDNHSHLYALPAPALNLIRKTASQGMDVYMEGPSQVAMFHYDNGTFAVHSFHNEPVEVSFVLSRGNALSDIASGQRISGEKRAFTPVNGHPREDRQETVVKVTIPPHSFRAFSIQ
ncbi:MAG: hypothetical protein IJR56_06510 [Bacteroidaceae bacterium]|nr:hypothetical protein [Bacteroidaceae bacterium]MBQ9884957.1 hypothetical protein [Bacteroidaceae bacterium]